MLYMRAFFIFCDMTDKGNSSRLLNKVSLLRVFPDGLRSNVRGVKYSHVMFFIANFPPGIVRNFRQKFRSERRI